VQILFCDETVAESIIIWYMWVWNIHFCKKAYWMNWMLNVVRPRKAFYLAVLFCSPIYALNGRRLSRCCLATYFLGAPGLFLQLWFGVAVREFMSVQLPFKLHICTERRMEHRDRRGRSTIHLATIKLCTSCSQTVYCRHERKIKEEEENYDEACLDVWSLLNMVALKRAGWFLAGEEPGQNGATWPTPRSKST
jgi:hypothetical protein